MISLFFNHYKNDIIIINYSYNKSFALKKHYFNNKYKYMTIDYPSFWESFVCIIRFDIIYD